MRPDEMRWMGREDNENNDGYMCELTGSILRPSQPFPLWVALNTDDVHAFSLLQSKVGFTAFAIHTSLPLMDDLQGPDQLTHSHAQTHTQTIKQKNNRLFLYR